MSIGKHNMNDSSCIVCGKKMYDNPSSFCSKDCENAEKKLKRDLTDLKESMSKSCPQYEDDNLTYKEGWKLFKEYAIGSRFNQKIVGDEAFINKKGEVIRLKSIKNGRVRVYIQGMGTFNIN